MRKFKVGDIVFLDKSFLKRYGRYTEYNEKEMLEIVEIRKREILCCKNSCSEICPLKKVPEFADDYVVAFGKKEWQVRNGFCGCDLKLATKRETFLFYIYGFNYKELK